jgi:hypothetical protein
MSQRLERLIGSSSAAAVLINGVVGSLLKVYDMNAARHEELHGDDPLTFGVLNWRNSWHYIEETFEDDPRFEISRPRGSLLLSIGAVEFRFYSHPGDEAVDIHEFNFEDGSLTKRQLPSRNQLKLDLDWGSDEARLEALTQLAFVHTGNPIDGLCAVWVGAPQLVGEDQPSGWAWVEEIWHIDRSAESIPTPPFDQTPHSELEVPDLDIDLIDGSEEDEESETGSA